MGFPLPEDVGISNALDTRINPATEENQTSILEVMGGLVDTGNSSVTPLGISGVFTGISIDITDYNTIFINTISDVASATDGLSIEQSSDDTNWDHCDCYTVNAGAGKNYAINPFAKYFRVIYTNGSTAQAYFRLQTIFKTSEATPSSHRIQDSITDEDDARLVKSVLSAKVHGDGFVNIQATTSENLRVTDAENGLAIAKGDVVGTTSINKFGQNIDIGTGAYEDIWDVGGTYPYPADATAPITYIDSNSVADTEPIEVQGLDINGDLVVQTVTLTGTTPVALTTPLWRVFRLKNEGTSDLVGNVQAINTADTVIYAQIDNGNNQTLMALYTIPNGKVGYLVQGTNNIIGTNRGYSIYGKMAMRLYGKVFQLKKTFGLSSDGTGFFALPFPIPGKMPAKTDIRVSAISSSAGGGINTTFDIVLIDI